MELRRGRGGGLARPACPGRPGGRGHRLTLEDRNQIQRGLDQGQTCAGIARELGRHRSSVSREVKRHRGSDGDYNALVADALAQGDAARPKEFKLTQDEGLCHQIEEWMDQGWSPRLISSVLARDHGRDRGKTVSHETIYQALYVQTRGRLRADLYRQLSTKRPARKRRGRLDGRGRRYGQALRISQRPASVADRAVPGHWEGDLIIGAGSASAIGTLVERSTRFVMLLHLPHRHDADTVATAMLEEMGQLPDQLRRSLTWDRGSELANYVDIQLDLQMPVYFADPHSPWQRGSNENTNRLLRHWFTKSSDLSVWSQSDLRRIAKLLNSRPRPTLDLDTPAQRLTHLLANPPEVALTP
nr:IS30 family transposase [Ruania rhizosphaerae]